MIKNQSMIIDLYTTLKLTLFSKNFVPCTTVLAYQIGRVMQANYWQNHKQKWFQIF